MGDFNYIIYAFLYFPFLFFYHEWITRKNYFYNNVLNERIKQFCKVALSNRNRNVMQATYTILKILIATFLKGEMNFSILKSNIRKILSL